MTASTLLHFYLVLHIAGFTLMAGSVVADFVINRKLNRYLLADKQKALNILDGTSGLPVLIGIGAFLLISTGIGMTLIYREAVTSMLWFRIKMVLVVIVVLNGVAMARPVALKLRKVLEGPGGVAAIEPLKSRLRAIYILQILVFMSIFVLSVFKF